MPDRRLATGIGVLAIALWATLALLTTATRGIPPFELLALSFSVAFGAGLALLAARGVAWRRLVGRPAAWLLGFAGLSLYHALYFVALKAAPPAPASLIAYLWPLLIVLFSALGPGRGLRARHLIGTLAGLGGTALLVFGHGAAAAGDAPALGFAAAGGCALVWSGYSVLNRRFAGQPSEAIVGICGAVALAGLVTHSATEAWVVPAPPQWAAIMALGVGPVGLAFLAWDYATKGGDLPLLGALSYLAPLLSTALLVATGQAPARGGLAAAAALIVGGAALAAWPGGTRRTRMS